MWTSLLTPIHTPSKRRVLEAISRLGTTLIASDVATEAGLPLFDATLLLNEVAAETGGHLQVSSGGTILYSFDPRFQDAYWLIGPRHFVRKVGRFIFNLASWLLRVFCLVMFFLVRMSVGVLLIVSVIAVIALAIIAILKASNNAGAGGDSGGGDVLDADAISRGFQPVATILYWTIEWLWDWWSWGDYLGWNGPTATYPIPTGRQGLPSVNDQATGNRSKQSDFLSDCFSFVFGEGNPNEDFDQQLWHALACVIRANQAVVVSEQLAPYTGQDPASEDWMLPILVRFNGVPEVTEKGEIIYVFSSFRNVSTTSEPAEIAQPEVTSSRKSGRCESDELRSLYSDFLTRQRQTTQVTIRKREMETYLPKSYWQFMDVPESSLLAICGFGGFVLLGSIVLLLNLGQTPALQAFTPLIYGLFVYAVLFFGIPLTRFFVVEKLNTRITAENELKRVYSNSIRQPSASLAKKLESAEELRRNSVSRQPEPIVYSTEKDYLEQQFT